MPVTELVLMDPAIVLHRPADCRTVSSTGSAVDLVVPTDDLQFSLLAPSLPV